MSVTTWQWLLVIGSSLALLAVTPVARTAAAFFAGRRAARSPNVWVLTSSLVISWLFAKSITNAANLGQAFGLAGGVAYAAYYLSFGVAGWVIYRMRTRGGFESLHAFLRSRFGRGALLVFSGLIGVRLFNEVWSNTMVIGSYFGETGSVGYGSSIAAFTGLTLAYSLKGGLSSSLLTDLIQMILFGILLAVILGAIFDVFPVDWRSSKAGLGSPQTVPFSEYALQTKWAWANGGNLMAAAIIQSLSYPFHDPVLTDRGFVSSPRVTLTSYLWAVPIGAVSIILFSFVGVFGRYQGLSGQAPVEVARLLGPTLMLVMNFIMVTSAASTLDSTFSSFAKLSVRDLGVGERRPVRSGRWAMVVIALLGSVPIFLGAKILSATTVSGTMVIGLAPVFTLWWLRPPPVSFFLSVGLGFGLGLTLALDAWPEAWNLTEGKYANLLTINLFGTVACYLVYLLPWVVQKRRS